MRDNNGTWGEALMWFGLTCVVWAVLLLTPIGQFLWYVLTGVNSVGVD